MDSMRALEALAAMFEVLCGLKGSVCGRVVSKEMEMNGCLPTECTGIRLLTSCSRAMSASQISSTNHVDAELIQIDGVYVRKVGNGR